MKVRSRWLKVIASLLGVSLAVVFAAGAKPLSACGKHHLFQKDTFGTLEQVQAKCCPVKAKALDKYAQSFEWTGRRIKPLAAKLALDGQWNIDSNDTMPRLSAWMKRRTKILERVFHILESAPIAPSECDVDTRAHFFTNQPDRAGYDYLYLGLAIIRSAGSNRHLVALSPFPVSGEGPSSSLDDPARYDIQYETADTLYPDENNPSWPLTDKLVITCHFFSGGLPYDLQIVWDVPPMVFKNQATEGQYLRKYWASFFYYDIDKGKVARFRRYVDGDHPIPRPLVNW